jgi:hypothetical protein
MKPNRRKNRGIALLAVLMVVVAITIISLSFISRSDGELAYGQNMKLHAQADSLAESGLEHARALILNPQDVSLAAGAYWTGASGQQLGSGDLYYDVSIQRHTTGTTPLCSFDVVSTGYRLSGGTHVAESTLAAELRLDPCIALWTGGDMTLGNSARVYGDVRCGGNLSCQHTIRGDAYAAAMTWGNATGKKLQASALAGVQWPPVTCNSLAPTYNVSGTGYAAAAIGVGSVSGYTSAPSSGNPAGVVYRVGDLTLNGSANITGTLVVSGNLTIKGTGNVITAVENYPAIVVGGLLTVDTTASVNLTANGLVIVCQSMDIPPSFHSISLTINGGLFVAQSLNTRLSTLTVTADHSRTALLLWNSSGGYTRWRQAGTAFFKNLRRQP